MQRTTTTWAASITKAVFATYVLQLVEQGRFDLDAPVARQLPRPLDAYAPYREKAALLVRTRRGGASRPACSSRTRAASPTSPGWSPTV
jgi:CubicO group peptidase (beta-lactamase class C family)